MAIIKPFTFRAGEKARAAEVNQNFDILYQEVNNQASEIQSLDDDITSIENSKANINGSSSQRFAVADAVGAYDAINRHTLEAIYPVGAIYIGTTAECPMSSLFGTWQLVSAGRALWTGDGSNANTTIAAGLPQINGSGWVDSGYVFQQYDYNGAFNNSGSTGIASGNAQGGSRRSGFDFYASRSSSIYGQSSTVQPPAYVVNVWRRIA